MESDDERNTRLETIPKNSRKALYHKGFVVETILPESSKHSRIGGNACSLSTVSSSYVSTSRRSSTV